MRGVFLLLAVVLAYSGQAQSEVVVFRGVVYSVAANAPLRVVDVDSVGPLRTDTLNWRQRHSPRMATLFSAVLPGAGQIYNRKYWKAPLVWGGLGVSFWFIQRNTKEYQRYKTAYLAVADGDPSTIDEFEGRISASQLLDATDTYRKWRDISYIAISAVYILNIVDACVDAHFVRFDVGRDLSMRLGPSLEFAAMGSPGISIGFALR